MVLVTAVSTPNVTLKEIDLGVKCHPTKPWEQKHLDFVFNQALNLESGEASAITHQK